MKTLFFCSAILFSSYCFTQKVESTNKIASKIYKQHLSVIGEYIAFLKQKDSSTFYFPPKFDESVIFLKELTTINCDINYGFDWFYEPSKENYKDWKVWYKLNKKNLCLDSSNVKIKDKVIPVTKNAIKYYRNKLSLVKKSIRRKLFEDPEYSEAIDFLRVYTGIKNKNKSSDLDVPSQKEIHLFENWLKENKNNLYWNIEHHAVDLRKSH